MSRTKFYIFEDLRGQRRGTGSRHSLICAARLGEGPNRTPPVKRYILGHTRYQVEEDKEVLGFLIWTKIRPLNVNGSGFLNTTQLSS